MKQSKSEKRVRSLCKALDTKAELLAIEEELKHIGMLIRNLPRKKRKLSGRYNELSDMYNKIIELEKLPLRKLI
ncbi:MAG: hypothetical protein KDC73_03880 [Ignavibacteriae bacterium]|nr:hypothetical protein [Ignavibacteriota bacterium]MCB0723816.1 hypothetical protein [Ignavibacteriota bacterium]MCB9244139.1 hypothetical protein [Ignavibacteriales bacterium]